ncbi:diguanylate cyclase [Desulfurivibrio dismutans]|uniref:diguanylate cyclase n=1 Tax=Desulfurivibrio dismutans TaxID=1398908 RepID=UPI0023DBB781|nr:diguanylate cyclase [Desulfurivibrio alkaliphilus]MDF1614248.1 diguanylate cyclase [Desulfurivibrio alkaliphilus]
MKHQTIVFRIGLSFALIALILVSILSLKSYHNARDLLSEQEVIITRISIDPIYRRTTVIYQLMEATIGQILLNRELIAAFAAADREALAALVEPAMPMLTELGINVYHFHLSDHTTLYRGHRPEVHGDSLEAQRTMPGLVHQRQQRLTGLEQGVHYLAYRHLEPVFFNGEYIGAIELGVNLDEKILGIWQRAAGGEWYLLRLDEATLSVLNGTGANEPDYLNIGPETTAALCHGEPVRLNHGNYLVQMVPLADFAGDYAWVLKRVYDNSELLAKHKKQFNNTVLFGLLIVLLGTVLTFLVLRWLLRPLEHLVAVARTWARKDLSQPVAINSNDEIGVLGRAMESMRRKLQRHQQEMATSRELFKILADFATDWIFWMDAQGGYVYVSPACEKISGYKPEEFRQHPWLLWYIIHPDDRDVWQEHLNRLQAQGHDLEADQALSVTIRIITKQGEVRWLKNISRAVYNEKREFSGIRGSNTDITANKQAGDKLVYLSFHDQLTGVYNRVYFEQELLRLNHSREPVAVIVADIDGLKIINDTLGHKQGDLQIIKASELLQASLRKVDILARIGGDEFVALLPNTTEKTGRAIVDRIQAAVKVHNQENPALPVSISCGVAGTDASAGDLEELLKKADMLMYQSKAAQGSETRKMVLDNLLRLSAEKDRHHTGHVENLQKLALRLGREAGLNRQQLHNLELLAQVHDLGKAAIPDELLTKKGPLTKEEVELLQRHPEIGSRIAGFCGEYTAVAELILKHHEKWDGTGYPLGLAGEEIPPECRVFAIVDAYDEMLRAGPLAGQAGMEPPLPTMPLEPEQARLVIEKKAGSAFDPRLVKLFLNMTGAERP